MFKLDIKDKEIHISSNHDTLGKDKIKEEIVLAINLLILHHKLMMKEKDGEEDHLDLINEIKDLPIDDFQKIITYDK